MRFSRYITVLLTWFLNAHFGQAQQVAPSAAAQAAPAYKPVYLLDSKIIVGENELAVINPNDIAAIQIYKGTTIPAHWRGLAEHGIVAITMKHQRQRLKTKPLASLPRWLKLTGPVRFELDGLPLEDTSLRIATAGIAGLDITRATAGAPNTVVNIRLVRVGPSASGPEVPGRIMIRGTAGL